MNYSELHKLMSLNIERNILLENGTKRPIPLDIFNSGEKMKPIVIFCHGFKGFKDWGHFNYLAAQLASQGLGFVKFNFSHNGSTGPDYFDTPDLEAFGDNNFSRELDDLGLVIDWVSEHASDYQWNKEQIYLIGHSRGGGVVLIKSAEDIRIKKCVTWAAVNAFDRGLDDKAIAQWKAKGVMYVENSRTMQKMPLKFQLYEDYIAHVDRLHIGNNAKRILIPTLLIHGTNDLVVPDAEARSLNELIENSMLHILEGEGHTFGASHPFDEERIPDGVREVIHKTLDFLKS